MSDEMKILSKKTEELIAGVYAEEKFKEFLSLVGCKELELPKSFKITHRNSNVYVSISD